MGPHNAAFVTWEVLVGIIGHDIHTQSCKCQSGFLHTDNSSDGILACLKAKIKTNKMKLSDITGNDLHLWRAPSNTHNQHYIIFTDFNRQCYWLQSLSVNVHVVRFCLFPIAVGKKICISFSSNWDHVEVSWFIHSSWGKSRLSCENSLQRRQHTAQGLWETSVKI